ncbi:DrmE family protein [Geoalkalibacter halelectricus]|uniref:DrmE family protein n=1 Tax=Geoalkalibacter halelectricus TaxID=2847045 RepID=UPI003D1FFEFC
MTDSEWIGLADDRLVAFPGKSFLGKPEDELARLGLKPFDEDESLLLGLCGRLTKDGHSLALILPHPSYLFFAKLLSYLHQVRRDALKGYVLGSHFQAHTLWKQNDLVWIGRSNQILGVLEKVQGLQPALFPRKGTKRYEPRRGTGKVPRTPLVSYLPNQADLLDLMHSKTRPFVFVIDATPVGVRDHLKEIWDGLSIYFPHIPVVIISALGDLYADKTLEKMPVHRWVHRLYDQHQWRHRHIPDKGHGLPLPLRHTLVEVPDATLESYIVKAYQKLGGLRRLVEGQSYDAWQDIYERAAKVQKIFATLCCPLPIRERLLARNGRRGDMTAQTVESELKLLSQASIQNADAESCRRDVYQFLREIHHLVSLGATGKAQALERLVREGVSEEKSTLILVADRAEEEAVSEFLHTLDIALVDDKFLSVKRVGQIASALSLNAPYSRCLIFSRLWDKDMWWLAGVARDTYWVCYPFENLWVQKKLADWEEKCARPSSGQEGKSDLLRIAWPRNRFIRDSRTLEGNTYFEHRCLDSCRGQYPRDKIVSGLQRSKIPQGLIEELEAEEHIQPEPGGKANAAPEECARITLKDSLVDIFWRLSRTVHVVCDKAEEVGVETKKVSELIVGEQVLLLKEDLVPLVDLTYLIWGYDSSAEFCEHTHWAAHWQNLIDSAMEIFDSPHKLKAALQQRGTSISLQTIDDWLHKKMIGSVDQESIKYIALAVQNPALARHAPQIHKALSLLWHKHLEFGQDLQRALHAREKGATNIQIGSADIEADRFDEIMDIRLIHAIDFPGKEPTFPKRLADLVPRVQKELGERISLTRRAIASMEDSPYRNLDKAWDCFVLVACNLWRLHAGELRKGEVMESFQQIGVELKSGTSQITQGACPGYIAKYEGKTVDIGAHLCLGTAHDPTKTLRIHYHWDSEKTLVVIHHAGRHLPTRYS